MNAKKNTTKKRLAKKIFVASHVYDTVNKTDDEITLEVQENLNRLIGSDRVRFSLATVGNEVNLAFERGINYSERELNEKLMYDADAYMICGIGLDGFKLPFMWYEPPFGFTYTFDQSVFIECYKKSARDLKASRIKEITLDISPSFALMKRKPPINYPLLHFHFCSIFA